ncbi:hypothetical protein Lsai_1491 [Legionella sainthelensi]|uniref:Uncharacterized protein n=1 Tax=Legionella sainthelensi TaxID=28087 RepID=A0A0W0YM12_9GAMM|nr:hypothetical protein [Legionella sainthelensi]KTD57969.1 hypothetical protein Lsai_1491 [Legionella sainthelensi]VEH28482.1 Uncharacterised protein [Legionella sainthelensi]
MRRKKRQDREPSPEHVEATFFPDKKQDLHEKYTADFNKQPSLSSRTKIAYAALAATIINIIPARRCSKNQI